MPFKRATLVFFLGDFFYTMEFPCGETLEFLVKTNLTLFNVTHTSIFNSDLFNKIIILFLVSYRALHYQLII